VTINTNPAAPKGNEGVTPPPEPKETPKENEAPNGGEELYTKAQLTEQAGRAAAEARKEARAAAEAEFQKKLEGFQSKDVDSEDLVKRLAGLEELYKASEAKNAKLYRDNLVKEYSFDGESDQEKQAKELIENSTLSGEDLRKYAQTLRALAGDPKKGNSNPNNSEASYVEAVNNAVARNKEINPNSTASRVAKVASSMGGN